MKSETDIIYMDSDINPIIIGASIGSTVGVSMITAIEAGFEITHTSCLSYIIFGVGGAMMGGIIGAKIN